MANLTIAVDEGVLRRARIRALEHGTSVNAVLRDYLERYVGMDPAERAMVEFLELTADLDAGSGPEGHTWTRDDLHDRAALR